MKNQTPTLDCEYRINAAKHFLDMARDDTIDGELRHIWYSQACVIFAVAAIDNLKFDFAEREFAKQLKKTRMNDSELERNFGKQTDFYRWLDGKVKKNEDFLSLKDERDQIIHRGEPPKNVNPKGGWTSSRSFQSMPKKTVDQACQDLCDWVDDLLQEAKQKYRKLN